MGRTALPSETCTIARAVAMVGDPWSILLLRELFLGNRRFDQFLRQTGMSSHLLSQRLKKLEGGGVVRRRAYCQHPVRYEYHLTRMGRDLWPTIIALKQWGDGWLGRGEPPVQLRHTGCGQVAELLMTCAACGEPVSAHESEPRLTRRFAAERQRREQKVC